MKKKFIFFLLAGALLMSHTVNAVISKGETGIILQHFRFINNEDDNRFRPLDGVNFLQGKVELKLDEVQSAMQKLNFGKVNENYATAKTSELWEKSPKNEEALKLLEDLQTFHDNLEEQTPEKKNYLKQKVYELFENKFQTMHVNPKHIEWTMQNLNSKDIDEAHAKDKTSKLRKMSKTDPKVQKLLEDLQTFHDDPKVRTASFRAHLTKEVNKMLTKRNSWHEMNI